MYIPDRCFALDNMTINPATGLGKVIEVRALETGFYKTIYLMTQGEVDMKNAEIGVSAEEAKAMSSASMFGWNCYKSVLSSLAKLGE